MAISAANKLLIAEHAPKLRAVLNEAIRQEANSDDATNATMLTGMLGTSTDDREIGTVIALLKTLADEIQA